MVIREHTTVGVDQLHFEGRGRQAIYRGRTARKPIERHLKRVTEPGVVDHLHDAGAGRERCCVVTNLHGHVLDRVGVQAPHGIPRQNIRSGGVESEASRHWKRRTEPVHSEASCCKYTAVNFRNRAAEIERDISRLAGHSHK